MGPDNVLRLIAREAIGLCRNHVFEPNPLLQKKGADLSKYFFELRAD